MQSTEVQTTERQLSETGTDPEPAATADSETQHELTVQEGSTQHETTLKESDCQTTATELSNSDSQTCGVEQTGISTQTVEDITDVVECSA